MEKVGGLINMKIWERGLNKRRGNHTDIGIKRKQADV